MKQKRIMKLLAVVLCMVFAFSFSVVPAFANSAQTNWEGVDSTGAIIVAENSPIVVEREVLTFDIQEFPANYYNDLQEYLAYSAKVTAEYAFYNPSDYTVTATLMFPFGCEPTYSLEYDYDTETSYDNVDTEKFDITIDGEVVKKTLRHTLSSGFEQFELESDLALLHDGYVKDAFYSPDLTVTKYTFEASGVDTETYHAATVGFDVDRNDTKRKIYFAEQSGFHTQDSEEVRVSNWVENGDIMTVYVLGKDYDAFPKWKFYEDGGVEDKEEISGTMKQIGKEKFSFEEFALSEWTQESGVSETDWYNAAVAMLSDTSESQGSVLYTWSYSMNLSSRLMRWYEYEITLEPGQRIVNTVTAPIYPSIDMDYEPSIYGYTYLLSPAKTWESFGELEIVINTPYYITENSLGDFTKTENGYTLKLSGLPDSELKFTLSTSETPQEQARKITDYVPIEIIISFSIIAGVVLLTVGGIIVFVVIRRKKKR